MSKHEDAAPLSGFSPEQARARGGERFALCHPQGRVWFTELLYPNTGVGNLSGCVTFPGGRGQLDQLGEALDEVVRAHDALRLRLATSDGLRCEQYLATHRPVEFSVLECEHDRVAALLEESKRPFTMADSPLVDFRRLVFPNDRIGVFFRYHHIIVDAFSVSLLAGQIHDLFQARARDSRASFEEVLGRPPSYLEFFSREQAYLGSTQFLEDQSFWHAEFDGYRPRQEPPRASAIATERFEHDFGPRLTARIGAFCEAHETTVFRFFMSVFFVYFWRLSHDPDLVLSTGHHNRPSPRDKAMAGMTVSTLPIRHKVDPSLDFASFARGVHQRIGTGLRHQAYPYDLLARHLSEQGLQPQHLLSYFINHIPSFEGSYHVERYSPGADLALLNIKLNPNQRPRNAPLEICVDARTELYDRAAIELMFERLEELVATVVENPGTRLRDLELLCRRERAALLSTNSAPTRQPPRAPSVLALFEETARRFPDRIAVRDARHDLTYRELDSQASGLAALLRERGVGPRSVVALIMGRSADFVIAMLAAFKAGATYLPITPDTPAARLGQILEQAHPALILRDGGTSSAPPMPLAIPGIPELVLADNAEWRRGAAATASRLPEPNEPAYVIFTSGSTGRPKGVVLAHRGLANLCRWFVEYCALTPQDRCSAYCSFMFDVSVIELLAPLVCGASVTILPEEQRLSVHALNDALVANRITVATLPTRVGELFNREIAETPLRMLVVAGERLTSFHPRGYQMINAYGPTEATVYATAHRVDKAEGNIPIGAPVANMWAYVVDEDQHLVPFGEEGNLLLAGPQIALGYLVEPESTDRAFLPNPFRDGPGNAMAYSTGDRVRWRADGLLEFVGRRDRQLKIRGFRVEPAEIEQCLLAHPRLRQCIVLAGGSERAARERLVAFYVSDAPIDKAELGVLCQSLPEYMRPSSFVPTAALPLTPNGKTDEARLWRLLDQAPPPAPSPAPTSSENELKLLAIWRRLLDTEKVGLHDSFFELGGDSLLAMKLFVELHHAFGRVYPVSLIFQHPTVTTLAQVVGADHAPPPDDALVLIQRGTGTAQLFCIHDFTGDVMCYRTVAEHLKRELTLYGIRYHDPGATPVASLEDLAARYLRQIRTAQPHGPYALLGYSIGGTLAYEIARQLRAQGEDVGVLAIIDTPNYAADASFWKSFSKTALRHVLAWLRAMTLNYKLAFVYSNLKQLLQSEGGLLSFLRAQKQMQGLMMKYKPEAYDGELVLFRAERRLFTLDGNLGWGGLARRIQAHDVAGNHISILSATNARPIAEQLNRLT